MIALEKIFGATAAGTATASISLKEVDRQAAIGDAAATAAIEAAWLGPGAAIAAASLVEGSLQAITGFEKGGIVRVGVHEGEAILPEHLTTFLMAAAGAPGGPDGRGGDGGPGGK